MILRKNLYLKLSIALLIISSAVFISLSNNYSNKEIIKNAFPLLADNLKYIDEIKIENAAGKHHLKKKNNSWKLINHNEYPVDTKKINLLFLQLANSSFLDTKEINSNHYSKLGINYPITEDTEATRIIISSQKEFIYDFLLGKKKGEGKSYKVNYFRRTNEKVVYLLKNEIELYEKELLWADTDFIKIARWRIKEIAVFKNLNDYLFKIYRDDYASQNYKMDNFSNKNEVLRSSSLFSLAAVFERLKILDVIPFLSESDHKNIKIYKKIKIETFDGLSLILNLIKINNDNFIRVNASSDKKIRQELPNNGEAIVGIPKMKSFENVIKEEEKIKLSKNWLYKIDEESFNQLNKNKTDYLQKK